MHVEKFLKLPDVRRLLSKRYRNGVNAAVARHQHARANEDTVTGALGQVLVGRGFFQLGDGGIVTWSTQYTRFGSSGKIGPGADGIFEIELSDDKGITTKKSLLFNSKKENYTFGQSSVRRQARQIAGLPGRGIVLDYRPDGFMAVDAWAVSQADRQGLRPKPLGDVLAEEFVGCSRGSSGYFYDPDHETINFPIANGSVVWHMFPIANLIRTRFVQTIKRDF